MDIEFKSDFLEYRAARYRNREVFIGNHAALFKFVPPVAASFDTFVNVVGSRSGDDGQVHAGLIPLLRLAQRQVQSALDAVTSFQAYEGWLLLRPAVEAVLIVGKWLDDPEMAKIWLRRFDDPRRYSKEYQGENLRSRSLPRSDEIQKVLKRINDEFAHPNPTYVMRHSKMVPRDEKSVLLAFEYFDREDRAEAGCLAMISLTLVLQESLREALLPRFSELKSLELGSTHFLGEFGDRIQELQRSSPDHASTLVSLGLCSRLVA